MCFIVVRMCVSNWHVWARRMVCDIELHQMGVRAASAAMYLAFVGIVEQHVERLILFFFQRPRLFHAPRGNISLVPNRPYYQPTSRTSSHTLPPHRPRVYCCFSKIPTAAAAPNGNLFRTLYRKLPDVARRGADKLW